MSLLIERSKVCRVMIANKWVDCYVSSFTIDAYEYIWRDDERHHEADLVCLKEYGFAFTRKDTGRIVFGPMSSIQAVEYNNGYDTVEYDNGYDKDEA